MQNALTYGENDLDAKKYGNFYDVFNFVSDFRFRSQYPANPFHIYLQSPFFFLRLFQSSTSETVLRVKLLSSYNCIFHPNNTTHLIRSGGFSASINFADFPANIQILKLRLEFIRIWSGSVSLISRFTSWDGWERAEAEIDC